MGRKRLYERLILDRSISRNIRVSSEESTHRCPPSEPAYCFVFLRPLQAARDRMVPEKS